VNPFEAGRDFGGGKSQDEIGPYGEVRLWKDVPVAGGCEKWQELEEGKEGAAERRKQAVEEARKAESSKGSESGIGARVHVRALARLKRKSSVLEEQAMSLVEGTRKRIRLRVRTTGSGASTPVSSGKQLCGTRRDLIQYRLETWRSLSKTPSHTSPSKQPSQHKQRLNHPPLTHLPKRLLQLLKPKLRQ
jgi:hypothetical protein